MIQPQILIVVDCKFSAFCTNQMKYFQKSENEGSSLIEIDKGNIKSDLCILPYESQAMFSSKSTAIRKVGWERFISQLHNSFIIVWIWSHKFHGKWCKLSSNVNFQYCFVSYTLHQWRNKVYWCLGMGIWYPKNSFDITKMCKINLKFNNLKFFTISLKFNL